MPKKYDFETDGAVVTLEGLKAYNKSLKDTGLAGAFARPITDGEIDLIFQGLDAGEYASVGAVPAEEVAEWAGGLNGDV